MRKWILLMILTALMIVLTGCSAVAPVDAEFGPFEDVQVLELEIRAADLEIAAGEKLYVQTDNPHITAEVSRGTLMIREEQHYDTLESSKLTIYIPEGMEFERVDMDTGAGRITADRLACGELELELGAGEADFSRLDVTRKADIEGGTGKFRIGSGSIQDLEFEMGVGEADLAAAFTGYTDIDAGVGALRIAVTGASMDAYTLRLTQGLGQITVNGLPQSGTVGSGSELLEVSGGVGSVEILFEE